MLTVKKDKVIIEINHVCPDEFVHDLKEALIGTIQYQDVDFDQKELNNINYTLLELLKNLVLGDTKKS